MPKRLGASASSTESVTPESIDRLMAQPDVDGALVGGASLVAEKPLEYGIQCANDS